MKPESARNLPPIYRLPDKTVLAKKVISDFVVIFIRKLYSFLIIALIHSSSLITCTLINAQ